MISEPVITDKQEKSKEKHSLDNKILFICDFTGNIGNLFIPSIFSILER